MPSFEITVDPFIKQAAAALAVRATARRAMGPVKTAGLVDTAKNWLQAQAGSPRIKAILDKLRAATGSAEFRGGLYGAGAGALGGGALGALTEDESGERHPFYGAMMGALGGGAVGAGAAGLIHGFGKTNTPATTQVDTGGGHTATVPAEVLDELRKRNVDINTLLDPVKGPEYIKQLQTRPDASVLQNMFVRGGIGGAVGAGIGTVPSQWLAAKQRAGAAAVDLNSVLTGRNMRLNSATGTGTPIGGDIYAGLTRPDKADLIASMELRSRTNPEGVAPVFAATARNNTDVFGDMQTDAMVGKGEGSMLRRRTADGKSFVQPRANTVDTALHAFPGAGELPPLGKVNFHEPSWGSEPLAALGNTGFGRKLPGILGFAGAVGGAATAIPDLANHLKNPSWLGGDPDADQTSMNEWLAKFQSAAKPTP